MKTRVLRALLAALFFSMPVAASAKTRISIIPIPFFTSDPNEGNTYGAQASVFFRDEAGDVHMILSPRVTFNTLIGVTGNIGLVYYPSTDEKMGFNFGIAQDVYRNFRLFYENRHIWSDRFYLSGTFSFYQDPYGRFWGLGQQSLKDNQSSYTDRSLLFTGEIGYYLLPNFRLSLRENFLKTDLRDGIAKGLPDTLAAFGSSDGAFDSLNLAQGLCLVYDTRPQGDYSTRGSLVDVSYLFSRKALGSDQNFHSFVADLRQLINFKQDKFVTALRFLAQKVWGSNLPFYQLSSLGGGNQLRGFAKNRFVDDGKILFGVEERIQLTSLRLFKVNFKLGIAPFFEVGEIFSSVHDMNLGALKPSGGIGVRLQIPPSTIVRADIGFGPEGNAVFVKADYPF